MNSALVCANAPPGNANAGLANRRREKLTGLNGTYHESVLVQSGIWNRWLQEATRLFAEYWKTGDLKHFQALGRHIDGMRTHDRRRSHG